MRPNNNVQGNQSIAKTNSFPGFLFFPKDEGTRLLLSHERTYQNSFKKFNRLYCETCALPVNFLNF